MCKRVEPHPEDDLIDDRALAAVTEDRLSHQHLAQELAWLVSNAKTPANIALFGPWGSGKSSLGNLLKSELDKNHKLKYVRFDAFKYAETPLRRHFLSQVARELGVSNSKFTDGLYRELTTTKFNLKWSHIRWILLVASVLYVLLIIPRLPALLDAVRSWDLRALASVLLDFTDVDVAGRAVPAVLISAGITYLMKPLEVRHTRRVPSGEEEFEKLFRELVEEAKTDRLVVFIDELDRCSPEEVVTTLETIRTFLEVEKCLFVVAADKRVLEYSLSKRVRQATPPDDTNPYYSSGSAYLDKIFQYQFEVPALTQHRLSRFALELVEQKGGVWEEVDRPRVVSVLIPTHVRSPRRVKVLLNNFVLTYRLAQQRAQAGMLDQNLPERAPELAKLVCLRTEFPLFAADLALDARLPELVLQIHGGEITKRPPGISDLVWERAMLYARGQLPLDTLLVNRDDATSQYRGEIEWAQPLSRSDIPEIQQGPQEEADSTTPTNGGQQEDQEEATLLVSPQDPVANVHARHGEQLIHYLQKTADIPGPRYDLIHLESPGAVFGLEPLFALALEEDAINARHDAVLERVKELDPENQVQAIRMLASKARGAAIGIEGSNALSTVLRTIGQLQPNIAPYADEIVDNVIAFLQDHTYRPNELAGAYILGLECRREIRDDLLVGVLSRANAINDPRLGLLITRTAHRVMARFPEEIAAVVAARLTDVDTAEEAAGALCSIQESEALSVVSLARDRITDLLKTKVGTDGTGGQAEGKGARDNDPVEAVATAIDMCRSARRTHLCELLAVCVLSVDHASCRDVIEERSSDFAPIHSRELTELYLKNVQPRNIARWPRWLDALDPSVLSRIDAEPLLDRICARLWTSATRDDPPSDEVVRAALDAIKRLADASRRRPNPDTIASLIQESVRSASVKETGNPAKQDHVLEVASSFDASGLVPLSDMADPILEIFSGDLRAELPENSEAAAVRHILKWAPRLLTLAQEESVERFRSAVDEADWLPEPADAILILQASRRLKELGALESPPFDASAIARRVNEFGDDFEAGLVLWICDFAETVEEAWHVLRDRAAEPPSDKVADALDDFLMAGKGERRLALAKLVVSDAFEVEIHPGFLTAIHFSRCDESIIADQLIDLFERAANNDHRKIVLELWKQLSPTDGSVRRRLIERVYIPCLRTNTGSWDHAFRQISLVLSPPKGTKSKLVDAILDSAPDTERRDRAEQELAEKGLLSNRRRSARMNA